jgi:hypothetical protein
VSDGFLEKVLGNSSRPCFIAIQLWIGVLFLIYRRPANSTSFMGTAKSPASYSGGTRLP